MQSLVGQLLVATPVLRDPNFERTVVLLVAHENGGAIGVVLNRATEVPVREVLGSWGGVATEPSVVFEGGPVQPEAAICLARVRTATTELRGFSRVQGTLGTVDLTNDPDIMREQLLDVRVFAGYAGWAPGQLEEEMAEPAWIVVRAEPDDVFAPDPDELWRTVLYRKGGKYSLIATMPYDPSLN